MPIAAGCHHIALVTGDLDAVIAFYREVFDANVEWDLREGPIRHAMIDLGGVRLHPFQLAGENAHASGLPEIFGRGHLDHFAIEVADRQSFALLRDRLRDTGASDGRIVDWGAVIQVPFEDPDGMDCEISLATQGPIRSYEKMTRHPYPEWPDRAGIPAG